MKLDKPVALNCNTHRQLRIRPMGGFSFAAGLHSAPLCASEFFAAAREYAIVFVRTLNQDVFPVVVLGLNSEENMFISADGEWNARYLPASVRAYPFALIESDDQGTLRIMIDEAYAGFGEREGIPLFEASGAPSPDLESKLEFLAVQQLDIGRTRLLGAELHRLNLLTERRAQLQVANQTKHELTGFWIVDEAKLNALGDADLLYLVRQGYLSLVTAHLMSIENLGLLAPKFRPTLAADAATSAMSIVVGPQGRVQR
jgi:hypothetical protein